MKKHLELYKKYHSSRENERIGLFTALKKKFAIQNVLYPGSFAHFTPSLVFPRVVYVDSDRGVDDFSQDKEVMAYIQKNKNYSQVAQLVVYKQDYTKKITEPEKSFDLLVSQYAGFISQACKKYLKKGGVLVVNNSHGDASMAHLDKDFTFIGVYNRKTDTHYSLSEKDLDSYFIPKKQGLIVTRKYLEKKQQGPSCTKTPSGYVFMKKR